MRDLESEAETETETASSPEALEYVSHLSAPPLYKWKRLVGGKSNINNGH